MFSVLLSRGTRGVRLPRVEQVLGELKSAGPWATDDLYLLYRGYST